MLTHHARRITIHQHTNTHLTLCRRLHLAVPVDPRAGPFGLRTQPRNPAGERDGPGVWPRRPDRRRSASVDIHFPQRVFLCSPPPWPSMRYSQGERREGGKHPRLSRILKEEKSSKILTRTSPKTRDQCLCILLAELLFAHILRMKARIHTRTAGGPLLGPHILSRALGLCEMQNWWNVRELCRSTISRVTALSKISNIVFSLDQTQPHGSMR